MRSAVAWMKPVMSKVATWRLNTGLRKTNTIDCRRLRPIWLAVRDRDCRDRRRQCNFGVQSATTTIPIVFTTGGDPVQEGFVASLNRPGGNVTGVSFFGTMIVAKALGLLHELIPSATVIAALANP